jgi:glycosyltransferase involved in cell wall biosynthesis
MRSADLFILPRVGEVFTVDGLQAMGAGMAVVAFSSSICDYLRPGETAVVCPEPTAAALAEAIEKLVTDRTFAREIAAGGAEYVRTHHSMTGMAERTAAAYRSLTVARATFPMTE